MTEDGECVDRQQAAKLTAMAWPSGSRGREAAKPAAAAPAAAPAAAAPAAAAPPRGVFPEVGEFAPEPSGEFALEPISEPISEPLSKRSGWPLTEPTGEPSADPWPASPLPNSTGCPCKEPIGPAHTACSLSSVFINLNLLSTLPRCALSCLQTAACNCAKPGTKSEDSMLLQGLKT